MNKLFVINFIKKKLEFEMLRAGKIKYYIFEGLKSYQLLQSQFKNLKNPPNNLVTKSISFEFIYCFYYKFNFDVNLCL